MFVVLVGSNFSSGGVPDLVSKAYGRQSFGLDGSGAGPVVLRMHGAHGAILTKIKIELRAMMLGV